MSESRNLVANSNITAPTISPMLDAAISQFAGSEIARGRAPMAIVQEAIAALPLVEAFMAPAPRDTAWHWLARLRKGKAPMTQTEFDDRVEAILLLCGDLPASVWNHENLIRAAQDFKIFFPTDDQVNDLLRRRPLPMMQKLWVLRLIANATPILPPPEEETTQLEPEVLQALAESLSAKSVGYGTHHASDTLQTTRTTPATENRGLGRVPETPPGWSRETCPIIAAARAKRSESGGQ